MVLRAREIRRPRRRRAARLRVRPARLEMCAHTPREPSHVASSTPRGVRWGSSSVPWSSTASSERSDSTFSKWTPAINTWSRKLTGRTLDTLEADALRLQARRQLQRERLLHARLDEPCHVGPVADEARPGDAAMDRVNGEQDARAAGDAEAAEVRPAPPPVRRGVRRIALADALEAEDDEQQEEAARGDGRPIAGILPILLIWRQTSLRLGSELEKLMIPRSFVFYHTTLCFVRRIKKW